MPWSGKKATSLKLKNKKLIGGSVGFSSVFFLYSHRQFRKTFPHSPCPSEGYQSTKSLSPRSPFAGQIERQRRRHLLCYLVWVNLPQFMRRSPPTYVVLCPVLRNPWIRKQETNASAAIHSVGVWWRRRKWFASNFFTFFGFFLYSPQE